MARDMALELVTSGQAREATVWLAWRPGDVEPHWVEVVTVPADETAMDPSNQPRTLSMSTSFGGSCRGSRVATASR
jgi:hypothetical protein